MMELGRYGVFGRAATLTVQRARILESLGYGTVWEGGSPPAELSHVQAILDATSTVKVATGIVNVWNANAVEVARSYHRIEAAHPGRFLLGIGVGHPEATAEYRSPYQTLVDYLDVLDAEGVPAERRILAALGPRVLRLAAARAAGAHPYLVTPEHTRQARDILGVGKLLAPEQRVVLEADPVRARTVGRPTVVKPYLGLTNYTANLQRLGFTPQDVAGEGSDRLIDALVVSGDDAQIGQRLEDHHRAGADHVAIQLIAEPDDLDPGFRRLAELLTLRLSPALRLRGGPRGGRQGLRQLAGCANCGAREQDVPRPRGQVPCRRGGHPAVPRRRDRAADWQQRPRGGPADRPSSRVVYVDNDHCKSGCAHDCGLAYLRPVGWVGPTAVRSAM